MKNRLVISESELVNLINKVINEAESANCKCCKRGPMSPSEPGPGVNTNIAMINYAQHKLCCKKCKDEQAGMVSSGGRRREFNEGLSPCAPVSCQQGLYQAPSNHPTHPCKCVRKGQLLFKKKPTSNKPKGVDGPIRQGPKPQQMDEYNNPFSLPGSGTGPNWLTQQANWQNYDGTPSSAPSPPTAFLNRMSQMSCSRKHSRYLNLINRWTHTAGGHGGGFSSPTGTINPNNPRWQSILASKIIWLGNELDQNC